nr:OmpA family protein [Halovulum dunhuangense]
MEPIAFDRAVDELRATLPKVFSLSAALPPPPEPEVVEEVAPPHFIAVRTEDGAVRLRGDVPDEQLGQTAETLAEAKFGFDTVINETVIRDDLPGGWSARVVGGLEGLGLLQTGQLEITATEVKLTGTTPSDEVQDRLRDVLAERLPDTAVALDVWTDEQLLVDQVLAVPAVLCAERLTLVLEAAQISFPPGETSIDETSLPIVDRLATILQECPGARFEIGGHTDSQGSESGNMALSQARADAVLAALLERGVDTVFLYARGYGESEPIADNGTEEGRAMNRRIAFSLVPGEDEVEADTEAGEILQAEDETQEDTGIETSRGESPTVIVVPAGTDPATVLPEAQDAAGNDAAASVAASDEPAQEPAPTVGDAAENAPAGSEDAPADATEEAGGEPDAPPAAEPDPDAPPRPMPRPESVSAGEGN